MIKNIIFDLGDVLIRVQTEKFKDNILSQDIDEKDFQNLMKVWKKADVINKFQTGKWSSKDFLKYSTRKLNKKISQNNFKQHYNNIFSEISQMKQLLSKLSKDRKYKLILLSNTDPLHYNYIRNSFSYISLFDHAVLSYKSGYVKPDKIIFRKLLKTLKIKNTETLYIDDLKVNCKSAEELGFKVIHYTNFKSFLPKFEILKNNH